ncbi:hypothetical protein UMM65_07690 [Aureibaculum sp. 2210JD6-5]|uniref:hypothetical protein n=1 Tax=Aureibaculum sp. 2210JD6-5 TaxID=3103957 RepID=UPI002AADEE7D|nr:hypothetical protein [Aureibaculum sp. 2210JD6-5]MDY7395120.1 hypothetical protein [Aureibaculum sp. 2210JD6-5]
MKKIIAIVLVCLGIQFLNAQSPWTRNSGKTYLQLGFTGLSYDAVQVNNKRVENFDKINDITLQLYAEYGITNNLEAQLIIPYKIADIKTPNESESISGVGNVSLGLKYKLLDKNWKISSGILFSANSIKIDENKELSTGFNSSTLLPYITAGSSYNKWYYFATIGYGYMTNDYSDFFKAGLEVGYNIIPNGHISLVLDTKNVVSKESAFTDDESQWFSHLDRQQYNAYGVKANYEFTKDKFGANFSFFGASNINNAPLAPTFNVGIYSKF